MTDNPIPIKPPDDMPEGSYPAITSEVRSLFRNNPDRTFSAQEVTGTIQSTSKYQISQASVSAAMSRMRRSGELLNPARNEWHLNMDNKENILAMRVRNIKNNFLAANADHDNPLAGSAIHHSLGQYPPLHSAPEPEKRTFTEIGPSKRGLVVQDDETGTLYLAQEL